MSNFDYPTSGERLNSAQRDQLLEQVKQQVALASAQELIQVEYSLILCCVLMFLACIFDEFLLESLC